MTRFSEFTAVTGFALIATAWSDAARLGRDIYGANPDCRIVYYGPADVRLERFLRARPVGYHCLADGGGKEYITAKLPQLEGRLTSCFTRVHQSFLVNVYHIRALDKSVRTVTVTGGDTLPGSDARYERVEARLDAAT